MIFVLIFLIIVGELITIGLTSYISVKGVFDVILEIFNNGYKVDKKVIEECQRKQTEAMKKGGNIFTRLLGMVILLTPGVNMLKSAITVHKWKKEVMDNEEVKKSIVPMTEEEKEQYSQMEGKFQKLAYGSFISGNDDKEQEFVGVSGHKTLVVDHGLTTIYDNELMPLDYTLDEVKLLNNATGYSYRIGKMDGKNVAIIGIPNSESIVLRLRFKDENYDMTHDYELMSEEEAQDLTFTVYPFTMNEEVEKIVEEIKQSRIDMATKANLEEFQIPCEDTNDLEQGPRLRRKF